MNSDDFKWVALSLRKGAHQSFAIYQNRGLQLNQPNHTTPSKHTDPWLLKEEDAQIICSMLNEARVTQGDISLAIDFIEENFETSEEQKQQLKIANTLLPANKEIHFSDLFALNEFAEDENDHLTCNDPAIAHLEIAEHMWARDRKQMKYTYTRDELSSPEVDGVEMPVYQYLCQDVVTTDEFNKGGMRCGFILIPTGGHNCEIKWDQGK